MESDLYDGFGLPAGAAAPAGGLGRLRVPGAAAPTTSAGRGCVVAQRLPLSRALPARGARVRARLVSRAPPSPSSLALASAAAWRPAARAAPQRGPARPAAAMAARGR